MKTENLLKLAMLFQTFIIEQEKQQQELIEFYQRSIETQKRGLQQLDLLLSLGKND